MREAEEVGDDVPAVGVPGDTREDDDVEGFGPIGVEGSEEEEAGPEARDALEALAPNGPEGPGLGLGPGTGGRGPPLTLAPGGKGPRAAARGSREAWPGAELLDAALAGRLWGNDANGEGAEESTADGVMNIDRVPSNRPPKSGSAFALGTAGGWCWPFATRGDATERGLEGKIEEDGPAPGDCGGSRGGPSDDLLGSAGAGEGSGCGGRIVAWGAADAGRTGGGAGLRSSSSLGMCTGRGGPVGAGTNFLSAFLKSGRSASSSRSRCRSYDIIERACSMSEVVMSSLTSLLCRSNAKCKLCEIPSTRSAKIFSYLSAF